MLSPAPRFAVMRHLAMPFALAAMLCGGSIGIAKATDGLDFVLPQSDGYGIAECMKPGMECGRVIADAWCEAHGHGHASAFGLSDDVTGSTKISMASVAPPPNAVIIHCGD